MKTRSSRRPEIVEILSSSDEEDEEAKKNAPKKRPVKRKSDAFISLLGDSDSDNEDTFISPRKRRRLRRANSKTDYGARLTTRRPQRSLRGNRAFASSQTAAAESKSSDGKPSPRRSIATKKVHQTQYDSDVEFARKLQQQEDRKSSNERRPNVKEHHDDGDEEFARKLQNQEDNETRKMQQKWHKKDAAMAATLHSEETKERDERKQKELDSMKDSKAGRAVLLAEKVIHLLQEHTTKGIEPVGKDDAVYLAENMMALQEVFETEGRPTHVCICYHYTSSTNMDSIRTDGLLTLEDRVATKNSNTKAVAFFGNGIYAGMYDN